MTEINFLNMKWA